MKKKIFLALMVIAHSALAQPVPVDSEFTRIERLERLTPKSRTVSHRLALGQLYRRVGHAQAAQAEAQALQRDFPQDTAVKLFLADCMLDAGRNTEALALLDAVAQVRSGSAQVQLKRSQALSALGKGREADAASALYHSLTGSTTAPTR